MKNDNNILSKIAIGISIVALAVSVYGISGCKKPRHPGFGGHHQEFNHNQPGGERFGGGEHGQRPDARGKQEHRGFDGNRADNHRPDFGNRDSRKAGGDNKKPAKAPKPVEE